MIARSFLIAALCFLSVPAAASGIDWTVVNPFRYFKYERSFIAHKTAYDAILAQNGGVRPPDIVERVERRLNTPDCVDPSNYDICAAHPLPPARAGNQLGWASRNIGTSEGNDPHNDKCYGETAGAYGYFESCKREYGEGGATRRESYVTPSRHAVRVALITPLAASHAGKTCDWKFASSSGDGDMEKSAPCDLTILIPDVPYPAGGTLEVRDEAGRTLATETIQVRDILVLGLGDSYASGEGNPDRPVRFSPGPPSANFEGFPHASQGLPVRSTNPQIYSGLQTMTDAERDELEYGARARWTSPDCHRSQYSYQFRVALELALEAPNHRAVTLIHLACSGAETLHGVFRGEDAREAGKDDVPTVVAQLQQAQRLLCARLSSDAKSYALQTPDRWGQPSLHFEPASLARCLALKRPIDLVLLSLGGNDVGFSGIVGYSFIPDAAAIAPIAKLAETITGNPFIFGPVCEGRYCAYVPMMQQRLMQTGYALQEALAIRPARVVQTSYERIPVDEHDQPCGGSLGLDVFQDFSFDRAKVANALVFGKLFLNRLQCVTSPDPSFGCLRSDYQRATGFHFVDIGARFKGRGICAASSPSEASQFVVPHSDGSDFLGFRPENFFPYAHRTRLFIAADDSFLTANSQAGYPGCWDIAKCPPPLDRLQLAWRALFGGAFHRSAEAHAIVADAVLNAWARAIVETPPPAR